MELLRTQIQIQWPDFFLILEEKRKQDKTRSWVIHLSKLAICNSEKAKLSGTKALKTYFCDRKKDENFFWPLYF